jgi:outer membrane protein OmpA-like peptidoglycan-associated protein
MKFSTKTLIILMLATPLDALELIAEDGSVITDQLDDPVSLRILPRDGTSIAVPPQRPIGVRVATTPSASLRTEAPEPVRLGVPIEQGTALRVQRESERVTTPAPAPDPVRVAAPQRQTPTVPESDRLAMIRLENIEFETGRFQLTADAIAELRQVIPLLDGLPAETRLKVTGHTDHRGTDRANQLLSENRARAVAEWLADALGRQLDLFQVGGRGEADQLASGNTQAGMARNRRVEIVVVR